MIFLHKNGSAFTVKIQLWTFLLQRQNTAVKEYDINYSKKIVQTKQNGIKTQGQITDQTTVKIT